MKTYALVSALAALSAVTASPTKTSSQRPTKRQSSLPAVSVRGNAFWAGDERFYLRGIDYQPGGAAANIDPLADTEICSRDIEEFRDLGINVIRVYAVDNSADHDECMQMLDEAGIYLVLDANNPDYSINRADPHPSYNAAYLQSVFATIEMFAQYDNTLAFFSGNEVMNHEPDTDLAAPYVKAVTRDMRNYMRTRGLRQVPVGYSAADVAENREATADFFNCGSDDMRSDFFAFNDYSWCNSNFKVSGWDQKVENFTDYGLPIFLSEWGCIETRPRLFNELSAMMSSQMSGVYSGGLMYEYSVEENEYGVVNIANDGSIDRIGEFEAFKQALEDNPAPSGLGGAATTTSSRPCPPKGPMWNVNPSMIPVMPSEAQVYMDDGAGEGPGLGLPGSQQNTDSGTASISASEGEASPTGSPSGGSGDDEDDDSASSSLHGPVDKAPFIVTGIAILLSLSGALLL